MFHDYCPVCHHHSLIADYSQPPDWLSVDDADAWLEEHEDDAPIGVVCDHCGYQAE